MIREVLGYEGYGIVERTEGKSVTLRNHGSNDDGEKATKLSLVPSRPYIPTSSHVFLRILIKID